MSRAAKILSKVNEQGPHDFRSGQRVQAHPGTDTWMRGDRYGTVHKVGRKVVHVNMDRSGRRIRFHPSNLLDAEGEGSYTHRDAGGWNPLSHPAR